MRLGPDWLRTIELARQWHCRPSEADEELAIWVKRWEAAQQIRGGYEHLATIDLGDDD